MGLEFFRTSLHATSQHNTTQHIMSTTSIPELSVDAQVLAKRLQAVKPGEVVTYSELSGLIKRDVQQEAASVLASARRVTQREHRAVFGAVIKVGLKRLDSAGIVGFGEAGIAKMHRVSRRTSRALACAEYETLTNADKVRFNTSASLLGAMELATKPSRIRALSDAVARASDKLPTAQVLQLFSK